MKLTGARVKAKLKNSSQAGATSVTGNQTMKTVENVRIFSS